MIYIIDPIIMLPKKLLVKPMNYLKTMNDIIKTTNTYKNFIKALKNATKKDFRAGITLTNNEIKDIMKVIKS